MTTSKRPVRSPDYGLDAPAVVYGFAAGALAGVVLIILGTVLGVGVMLGFGIWAAVLGAGTAGPMVYSSKVGKIRVRDRVLDRLDMHGDADVLDLGCGSGLMIVGAAQRLNRGGTATGIDLWRSRDQAGSDPEKCLDNACRLGVEDRITLRDGDITDLPFPDSSFDVVLASLAIHNLHPKDRRRRALQEAARVLRPGGRLTLIDIAGTKGYVRAAREAGLVNVARSGFIAGIWPPARVVTAQRPG